MKGKIIGLVIVCMLISTFFAAAQPSPQFDVNDSKPASQQLLDDPVPVWDVGDTWTYQVDEINVNFEQDNQTIDVHLEITNLPLEVTDTSGGQYTVTFSTEMTGDLYAHIVQDGEVFDIYGTLARSDITGTIYFNSATLGIAAVEAQIQGRMDLDVKKNGDSILPFFLPIPATIDVNIDLETPYTLLHFPLNTSCFWGLPGTNVSFDGTVQSVWLNIINFVDTLIVIFLGEENAIIPPDFKDLFPVLDISDVMTEFGFTMPMPIPGLPTIFTCFSKENVTVLAGTYEAYNISMLGGLGYMFYAPEIKNIIKIDGAFADELPFVSDIKMELIATNVS
jgi:hypothetical protein